MIVKPNTNTDNRPTRAVMRHVGNYTPHGAPDTFGCNVIDTSQTARDTVALIYPSGVGLPGAVNFG